MQLPDPTMCPPEMNDVSLAEAVVIAMRIAATKEMKLNNDVSKPTLQTVLEFGGERAELAVESAPHTNVMIYNSTYEGAELIADFMDDEFVDTEASRAWPENKLVNRDSAAFDE